MVPTANKYYLCADTHQYQQANIKLGDHHIIQYVVGTGGTECDMDDIPPDNEFVDITITNNEIKMKYKLLETKKSFGFLHCTKNDNEHSTDLVFQFINVKDCKQKSFKGGKKKKRTKHKRKNKNKNKNKRTKKR